MANWKGIIGQTNGLFRQMLQKSIPKYNGEPEDATLYVEFQDFLGKNYAENSKTTKRNFRILSLRRPEKLNIRNACLPKNISTDNLARITVDQAIRENIHMDVNIEEDKEEEKIRRIITIAKRGGFPGMGMPGNMNNLMKQAQKMQPLDGKIRKLWKEKEFTATAGGGAVDGDNLPVKEK